MGQRQGHQAPSSGERPERGNLYEEVTARVVAELEQGRVPWVQPWGSGKAALGLPRNGLSGQRYSGINILILWGAVIEAGYPSQFWLTYRQAFALDGHVRKGERGVTVFYADRFTPKDEIARAEADGDEPNAIPFLKRFTVFNAAQCEALPPSLTAAAAPLPERMVHEDAEKLIAATNADFRVGGDRAYYVPPADYIQVPPQPAFFEQINYYRTCFHELGHWTGHEKRLARDLSGGHGSKTYAREELVAEMTSAFLCASLGIVPTVRHADYLGSWLEVLREDNRAIFRAASHASKAADFIRAFARVECGDPKQNILAGTAYLKELYERFGRAGVFAAYNAGPERYQAYLDGNQSLPEETRAYLATLGHVVSGIPTEGTFSSGTSLFFPLSGQGSESTAAQSEPNSGALFVPLNPPEPGLANTKKGH